MSDETNVEGTETPEEAKPRPTIFYVNAYSVSRHYGGPEEGGWWYDVGRPLASVPISADLPEETVAKIKDGLRDLLGWPIGPTRQGRYSVIGDSDFEIYVEDSVAEGWPKETPHYE